MEAQDLCQWMHRVGRCGGGLPKGAVRDFAASQAEDQAEGFIDGSELACVQAPDGWSEAFRINDGRLLDDDTRRLAVEGYGRAEARRPGAGGRR